jgi:hypothetical protein
VDVLHERFEGLRLIEKEWEAVSFAFQLSPNDLSCLRVAWTVEKKMTNGLNGDSSTMWAAWRPRSTNAEQVNVEANMSGSKLRED